MFKTIFKNQLLAHKVAKALNEDNSVKHTSVDERVITLCRICETPLEMEYCVCKVKDYDYEKRSEGWITNVII